MTNLFGTADLIELPDPEWLIEGILPEKGLFALYGPPGAGKSFIAIDLAMVVAADIPWQGHTTKGGPVLYVSAEGGRGIAKRVKAWLLGHKVKADTPDALWLVQPIDLAPGSSDLDDLVEELGLLGYEVDPGGSLPSWRPSLIVVDTLARCFVGDENLQEDMGSFIKAVDHLRHTFDTAVLIVHHSRLDGERERGSTAFRGAADTVMKVQKSEKGLLTLTCEKQKDSEEFEPIELELSIISDVDSCIVKTKQDRIELYVEEHPNDSIREIAEALRVSKSSVHRRLVELSQTGGKK